MPVPRVCLTLYCVLEHFDEHFHIQPSQLSRKAGRYNFHVPDGKHGGSEFVTCLRSEH